MATPAELFAQAQRCLQIGDWRQAEQFLQRLVRADPQQAEALSLLGLICQAQGRLAEAVCCYRQALRLRPDDAALQGNLGVALARQGRLSEALASFRRAVRLKPEDAQAHCNLGNALREAGKLGQAVACLRQALRLQPDYAEAHNNLGLALTEQGKLDEALVHLEQALTLKPDFVEAHCNRAYVWLLKGDWERGWPEYEWRWKRLAAPPRSLPQPLWDGSPLQGRTILLHAEQGLGDTIQFIRYAALVKRRGGTVLVECQPALVPLLTGCAGIDGLFARGSALPDFDVQAPLLSLPRILGTTLATVPTEVPYLTAEAGLVDFWRWELRAWPGFRIGIAWQGSPAHQADRCRSVPLAQFAPLARLPGVRLVSLQKGPGREQLAGFSARHALVDLGNRLDETAGAFRDTAAVMKNLDLVISADTAVAHLAGALAVPAWVVLPFHADWRWLHGRDESPWYPTLRLFRQDKPGDWEGVFHRLVVAVTRLQAQAAWRSVERQ
jgi:Flp pilus assembly protein TadD